MTPEVAKRLSEITVDVSTVKVADPGSANGSVGSIDLNGKWTMTVDAGGQLIDLNLEITQADNGFTGTMASPVGAGKIEKGKVDGNKVTGTIQADVQGSPTTIEMSGTLEGDKMKGTLNVPGFGTLPFTAARPR